MLRSLRLCLMQSDRDAERIIALGADPRSVHRTGNIKFDQPLPAPSERKVTRMELGLAPEAPLLVAGSTHGVEEEMLVDAYCIPWRGTRPRSCCCSTSHRAGGCGGSDGARPRLDGASAKPNQPDGLEGPDHR
jgi:hypothetical protein